MRVLHRIRSFITNRNPKSLLKVEIIGRHVTLENQTRITYIILIGTVIVCMSIMALLFVSYFFLHNTYVIHRIIGGILVLLYLSVTLTMYKRKYYKLVAWMLVFLYILVSSLIILYWGVNTPLGILMFGLVVVLTSATLGSYFVIPISLVIIIILFTTQVLITINVITPDRSSFSLDSTLGDVISYCSIFGVFALLSWLSRRQMEKALINALNAESELEREKKSLAQKVERATLSLKESQIQEMKQLYRFAELGQLTAVVLHELANHLSVLTLDIDELGFKHKKSNSIRQARESIGYIDTMIYKVRKQLRETGQEKRFDVISLTSNVIKELTPKATSANIHIKFIKKVYKDKVYSFGDSIRLSHGITILINNAFDASIETDKKIIEVQINEDQNNVHISVLDRGIGIKKQKRKILFKPLMSTKKNGLGIGLYITKEIIETHFKGKLYLDPRQDCTRFVIELPKYDTKSRKLT